MGADYKKHQKSLIGGMSYSQVAANLTRYFHVFGGRDFGADEATRGYVAFACRLTNLFARATLAPGVGETFQFTLMVNGAPSALDLTIVDPNLEAGPDVSVVALVPGDYISMRCISSLNAAASYPGWTLELNR